MPDVKESVTTNRAYFFGFSFDQLFLLCLQAAEFRNVTAVSEITGIGNRAEFFSFETVDFL